MNKIIIIIVFGIVQFFEVHGQSAYRILDGSVIEFNQNKDVKGSVFMYDDWMDAELHAFNGEQTIDIKINYDALNERFIALLEDDSMLEISHIHYRNVIIDKDTFINLIPYKSKGFGKLEYLGEQLVCFEKLNAKKTTVSKRSYNEVSEHYKIVKDKTLMLLYNENLYEIKRNKKSLQNIFETLDIENLMKSESIKKLSDQKDWIKLLRLIESEL